MKYDNGRLICKSVEPFLSLEKTGAKPNTIRVVPIEELVALGRCQTITVWLHRSDSTDTERFTRAITDIVDVTEPLDWCEVVCPDGHRIVCISWNPES